MDIKADNPKIFKEQNKIKKENKIQLSERKNPQKKEISPLILFDNHLIIPLNLLIEAKKSICKIYSKDHHGWIIIGTGFFMKINDSKKYLITVNHNILQNRKYEEISFRNI